MIEAAVHPLDRPKLRRLGEMLCEVSAGELTTRAALLPLISNLMICRRDDCRAAEAGGVLDRLLALADHWYGADALGAAAPEIIVAYPRAVRRPKIMRRLDRLRSPRASVPSAALSGWPS
jgi:hypothetical protein